MHPRYEDNKRWKEKNPEKCKEYKKKWRENNPEKQKECAKKNNYKQRNKIFFGGKRETILKRDNYECQICGQKERLLIHHFNENRKDTRYWNLLTLCYICHRLVHLGFF